MQLLLKRAEFILFKYNFFFHFKQNCWIWEWILIADFNVQMFLISPFPPALALVSEDVKKEAKQSKVLILKSNLFLWSEICLSFL